MSQVKLLEKWISLISGSEVLTISLESEFCKTHTGEWMDFIGHGIIFPGLHSPTVLKPVPEKYVFGAPAKPKVGPVSRVSVAWWSWVQCSNRLDLVHHPLSGSHMSASHVGECRGMCPCNRSPRSAGRQERRGKEGGREGRGKKGRGREGRVPFVSPQWLIQDMPIIGLQKWCIEQLIGTNIKNIKHLSWVLHSDLMWFTLINGAKLLNLNPNFLTYKNKNYNF